MSWGLASVMPIPAYCFNLLSADLCVCSAVRRRGFCKVRMRLVVIDARMQGNTKGDDQPSERICPMHANSSLLFSTPHDSSSGSPH